MADVDDVQMYARKFQNQLEKVTEADIDAADKAAIERFVRHEDSRGISTGTVISSLNRIRLSAERADKRLVDMDRDDVDALLFALKHDHDLSDGTVRNYRKALKKFFRYRGEEWAEDITIGAAEVRKVDPNDLLTDEEINEIIDEADSPRDKATIAMLADTGLRIGALCSLRVRDIDFSGRSATVSINTDGNVKDASGTIPLTWSEGFVGNWLEVHPRRDEDHVALLHKERMFDEDEDGALTYQYLSRRIREIAEAAGVDPEKVNTHNFRKTAISRWIREGLSEQAIKHRATWDVDSTQIKAYSGVRDDEINDQILDHYSLGEPQADSARPDLGDCKRCGAALRPGSDYCAGCGAPQTVAAAEALDDAEAESVDALRDTSVSAKAQDVGEEIFHRLKNDDEFARQVAESLTDE